MDNSNKKSGAGKLIGTIIAIVAIVAIVIYANGMPQNSAMTASSTPILSDEMASTSMRTASSSQPTVKLSSYLAYAVYVPKSAYSRDENIPITISILNLADKPQTLNFPNGCQGDYIIGDFDMIKHTRCLPSPSSFTIAPKKTIQVGLEHYPSVQRLAPGKYTLKASVIGYGSASVPITITQ